MTPPARAGVVALAVVIVEDPRRGSVQIVELTASCRPDEGPDRKHREQQREWNDEVEGRHGFRMPRRRAAFFGGDIGFC